MFEIHKLQAANATWCAPRRANCIAEPDLVELMRDPMTLALMAADRVDHNELHALFARVRNHLR